MTEDRCVCCGEVVPEGTMICHKCESSKKKTKEGLTIVDGKEILRLIAEKYKVPTDCVRLYLTKNRTDSIFALVREDE